MRQAKVIYEHNGSATVIAPLGPKNKLMEVNTTSIFALLIFLRVNRLQVSSITSRLGQPEKPIIK